MLSVLSFVSGNKNNVKMRKHKELVVEKLKKNVSSLEETERGNLPLEDLTVLCRRQVAPVQCRCLNTVERFCWMICVRMEHIQVLEVSEIYTAAKGIPFAHIVVT